MPNCLSKVFIDFIYKLFSLKLIFLLLLMRPVQYRVCIYIKARHLGGQHLLPPSPPSLPPIDSLVSLSGLDFPPRRPHICHVRYSSTSGEKKEKKKKRVKKEYPGNGGDTRFFFYFFEKKIPCGEIFQLRPGRQRPPSENTFFFFLGINRPICYASSSSSLATLSSKGG